MKRLLPIVAATVVLAAAPARMSQRQFAQHVLDRLTFGARPGEVDALAEGGIDAWIDRQLHPERIDDHAVEQQLASLPTLRLSNAEIIRTYYEPVVKARREAKADAADREPETGNRKMADDANQLRPAAPDPRLPQVVVKDLVTQRILRAAESDRQLNEVMVDFWMNHFNVFAGKGVDRFLLTSYERDTIRPRIWGNFEDLLLATAKSPAMLFYLDNARSANGKLNENYAREIMELHTLGVDGGYTQKDVTELARVLTGWTIVPPQNLRNLEPGTFVFRPFLHDRGSKTVLGVNIAAGGGIEEGERMIHVLAHHPSTAHHIAYKLCQRFVADDPPKALVDRVAARFLATGGDLRETVKAVITSPEFRDPKYAGAKTKSPFEYAVSAIRAVDAKVVDATPLARALQQMGEPLYGAQPPTGYSEKSSAWINTGALMNRVNFAVALASNKLPGVQAAAPSSAEAADALARRLGGPDFQRH